MNKYLCLFPVLLILSACATMQPPPPPPVTSSEPPPVVRSVAVTEDISLGFNMSLEGWEVDEEAPAFLLDEFVHHIEHELEDMGQVRTQEEMLAVARKRLEANELYIFDVQSRSYIMVDFSQLHNGEKAPSRQAVYNSARYASESLAGEEGVSEVRAEVDSVAVAGAEDAFRLDADYLLHGEERKFAGVIGFADPYWFFIYYTDTLAEPGQYPAIDNLLDNLTIIRGAR